MFTRLVVAILVAASVLLIVHIVRLLVENTKLSPSTIDSTVTTANSSLSVDINYEQLAKDIMASRVFESPPLSHESHGGGSENGSSAGIGGSKPDEPPIDAASKIRLIGTAVGTRPLGRAVVEDITTKKQSLYHLYDLVPNVGEIVEIREESILIRRGRKEEWLQLQNVKRAPPRRGESGTAITGSQASGES